MTKTEYDQDLQKHRQIVRFAIFNLIEELKERAEHHDDSKFEEPESSAFVTITPKLKTSTYGSEEYKTTLKEIQPAIDHHYANNRHHPEHFADGVLGMDIVDLIEMICDWYAAGHRHENPDFERSVLLNAERFNLDPQLKQIILNSQEILA